MTDEPTFLGYRLTITVAGPEFRDTIVIEDDTDVPSPTYADVGGMNFERYFFDTEDTSAGYAEVRYDYIVARRLERIFEVPPPPEPKADLDTPPEPHQLQGDQQ